MALHAHCTDEQNIHMDAWISKSSVVWLEFMSKKTSHIIRFLSTDQYGSSKNMLDAAIC